MRVRLFRTGEERKQFLRSKTGTFYPFLWFPKLIQGRFVWLERVEKTVRVSTYGRRVYLVSEYQLITKEAESE